MSLNLATLKIMKINAYAECLGPRLHKKWTYYGPQVPGSFYNPNLPCIETLDVLIIAEYFLQQ
jgi:NAD-dependent SIR2 family protein deacetylase